MKNRIISYILAILFAATFFIVPVESNAATVSPTSKYYISFYDTVLIFDEDPVMKDKVLFAQADVFVEYMEAELSFDAEAGKGTVAKGDIELSFSTDSTDALLNGASVTLPGAPFLQNGILMLPAVFVYEAFGYITYYTTNYQKRLAVSPAYSDEVYEILESIEDTCYSEKLVDWIINLYDPESGGFYFKKSAKDTLGFLPDKESTANCLGMLSTLGTIDKSKPDEFLTDEMQEKLISFARKYYNPEDGNWYELPWGKYVGEGKVAYQSSSASQILKLFKASPTATASLSSLDPAYESLVGDEFSLDQITPAEPDFISDEEEITLFSETDPSSMTVEERYESMDNFKAWLNSLSFDNIYSTGSLLLTNLGHMRSAGDEYYDYAMEFIEAHMNPRTGFFSKIDSETGDWVDEISYDSMSGTYKVSAMYADSYYASLGGRYLTMPYFDKLLDSTMEVMLSDEGGWHACDLTNPWSLIRSARYSQKDVLNNPDYKAALDRYYEKLPLLLENTQNRILALLCDDGSYTYYANYGAGGNKGVLHGLNLKEGELSGASMVVALRERMYQVLMMPLPKLFGGKIGPAQIKEKLASVEPTKKIVPIKEYNEDFDDTAPGKVPSELAIRYSGDVTICEDPIEGHGNSIKIVGGPESVPMLYFDVGSSGSKGFTAEFDIRFEPCDGNNHYMVSKFGSWDTAVSLSYRKHSGYCRLTRVTNASKWLTNYYGNWWQNYHTIKVEYIPDCSTATTKYYLDGTLMDTSTYYVNTYDEVRPSKDISHVEFRADHQNYFVGYIDNFKFRENP